MFWRLVLTYLLLVVSTVVLMGLLTYQRAEDVFYSLVREVAAAVLVVVLAADLVGETHGPNLVARHAVLVRL